MALSELTCVSSSVHCDPTGEFTKIQINNGLTTGSLSDLAPHTKVASLTLISTPLVDGDLQDLAPLDQLEFLDLYGLALVTGDLSVLGSSFPMLQEIGLQGTAVHGSLTGLRPLTRLTDLNLESVSGLTGDLSDIRGLALLHDLDLGRTAVTGNLSALQAWPRLSFVYLSECKGIYGDLAFLSSLHQLEALFLRGCDHVQGDVASLPQNNYTKLELGDTGAFCNSLDCTVRRPAIAPNTLHPCGLVVAQCQTEPLVRCYQEQCSGHGIPEDPGQLDSLSLIHI